jgi:hypothetical protein
MCKADFWCTINTTCKLYIWQSLPHSFCVMQCIYHHTISPTFAFPVQNLECMACVCFEAAPYNNIYSLKNGPGTAKISARAVLFVMCVCSSDSDPDELPSFSHTRMLQILGDSGSAPNSFLSTSCTHIHTPNSRLAQNQIYPHTNPSAPRPRRAWEN